MLNIMNDFQTVNDVVNESVRNSSYYTVAISSCVFILYTLIVNLISYFKGKKEGIISLTIIALFRALSFELSIALWETLKKVMKQKAVEHFSKTFDTK